MLDVFCDYTATALLSTSITCDSFADTARLIQLVVALWKLLNCKSSFYKHRFNNPDRVVIDSVDCPGITHLKKWANGEILKPPCSGERVNTLTSDTYKALMWTCKSLIGVATHLLQTTNA